MITDRDEQEALYNLNPCTDKLGKDRDFRDAVSVRLNALETKVRELELIIESKRKSDQSK